MITIILTGLEETINKSIINDFRDFLTNFFTEQLSVVKWMIYSDYCIDDNNKLYNSFTFTVFPYIIDFNQLKEFIKNFAPKDLKKTKYINEKFYKFIKSGFCFNFAFVINKNKEHIMFGIGKHNYIKTLDLLVGNLERWIKNTPKQEKYYKNLIKKVEKFKQEVSRKNSNLTLYGNIFLTGFLAAYISYLLTKECKIKPEIIGWFSDRDNITTYKNLGLIGDLYSIMFHDLCDTYNIDKKSIKITYADTNPDEQPLWYDEMLRSADYLSGALAGKNYNNKYDKYDELFKKAIINNKFLSIIHLKKEADFICMGKVNIEETITN